MTDAGATPVVADEQVADPAPFGPSNADMRTREAPTRPSDDAKSQPRGPGRPPGGPKRGGRRKGTPNKVTRAGREAILAAAPHAFLIKVMKGCAFKRADREGARRSVAIRPTLEQSIAAANILLRKMMPDLQSTALTGADGGPVEVESEVSDLTVVAAARTISYALHVAKRRIERAAASTVPTEPVDVTPPRNGSVPEAGTYPFMGSQADNPEADRIGEFVLEQIGQDGRWAIRRATGGVIRCFASTRAEAVSIARSLQASEPLMPRDAQQLYQQEGEAV